MADKKRKGNPAFMKPMQPDAALAAVVGVDPKPRTEVTKKIWDYIKSKGLQDPADKRMIVADEKLKAVFDGRPKVTMFEMTKYVNNHLQEPK
ncbi:MAG: SWIB/MDM2 domain-containing protein [Gemmatimonadota bacterium]|nr:SWIB/MDM2 domain-containing protein [Gemmatimonadota bacterium]